MENTILSYLEDSYKFSDTSTLLKISNYDIEKPELRALILDHTIMYPQGGGQPYDIGLVSSISDIQINSVFEVSEVRYKDGLVYHIGEFKEGFQFEYNSKVLVSIDEQRRRLHARLHSAGHLVDDALYSLLDLPEKSFNVSQDFHPIKGYHFPDGPYVEYEGEMMGDLIKIASDIEEKINEIIKTNFKVQSEIVENLSALKGKCYYVPTHIPEGKPIRLIYVSSLNKGQPCGGTHVKYLSEVGYVSIPKIKVKSGNIRISYLLK